MEVMSLRLRNAFWEVEADPQHALIASLRFEAARGTLCGNLLKTRPTALKNPIAAVFGAQSGYFDAADQLHHSSSSKCLVSLRKNELVFEDIAYGDVRETWRLKLDESLLSWTIEQEWTADAQIKDSFFPGLFFSAHENWGCATVFQVWNRDVAQDDYYGKKDLAGPEGPMPVSRTVTLKAGACTMVKLLSRACPSGDLRVTTSGHVKKGELLNYMSLLAQSLSCEPSETRKVRRGEKITLQMILEPMDVPTGLSLETELSGPLQHQNQINRRFYDTHMNCGIMADTQNWRFGNEPSGYVALFCQFMYSEMAKFGVLRGPLCSDCMDGHRVLAHEVEQMSQNLLVHGTLGRAYLADTALDSLPAYLIALRDLFVTTGDREMAERVYPGGLRAFERLSQQLDEGRGMIFAARDQGNDYWDWIDRDGRITSVNVLAHQGLNNFAELSDWLDRPSEARAARELAERIKTIFNTEFWDEKLGFYADWIDVDGRPRVFGYAGPQLQAIVTGMVPPQRARRLVEAIIARRRELGPDWENCFSLQTNLYDAEEHSAMRRHYQSDVTRFGQTMNGGCLVSWNYYWIGALAAVGMVDAAIDAWSRVVHRFDETSLVEGSNFWDFSGKRSRTTFAGSELDAYEPFLADQGLVSVALPRWLLGIDPRLDGLSVTPVLPASAYPATAHVHHLGAQRTIEFSTPGQVSIANHG